MPIYLLTNKVTHARAVVIARNAHAAKRVHPTNDLAHRRADDRGWAVYGSNWVAQPIPPPPGWPVDLALVHADELAHEAHRDWDGSDHAIAYQESLELRVGGPRPEGPDESWGGYTLDHLQQVGRSYPE